jgi:hypothetical protein
MLFAIDPSVTGHKSLQLDDDVCPVKGCDVPAAQYLQASDSVVWFV